MKVLGIELRYSRDKVIRIGEVLSCIFEWNEQLIPDEIEELSDEMAMPQPWTHDSILQIEKAAQSDPYYSILLSNLDLEETGIKIRQKEGEFQVSIGIENIKGTPLECINSLLNALKPNLMPTLLMAFDRNSDDGEAIFFDIKNFKFLAPINYFEKEIISDEWLNGLQDDLVKRWEIESHGTLLSSRDNLWKKANRKEKEIQNQLNKTLMLLT